MLLVSPPPLTREAEQWEEVPILRKTIELYKTYYTYAELFPKKDKYTLGATCERCIISIIELLLEASYLPRDIKRASLMHANTRFESLKVFTKILYELKVLEPKKYAVLQTHIHSIGRDLGAWMKSLPASH